MNYWNFFYEGVWGIKLIFVSGPFLLISNLILGFIFNNYKLLENKNLLTKFLISSLVSFLLASLVYIAFTLIIFKGVVINNLVELSQLSYRIFLMVLIPQLVTIYLKARNIKIPWSISVIVLMIVTTVIYFYIGGLSGVTPD